jgi:hypothetical protein
VVANVLLDEAVAIITTNNGVGKLHIRDLSLQLAAIALADLATEDRCDFVRLSDRSICIGQAFAELLQCRTAMKDSVVAELDLREEQKMPAARLLSLYCYKKWHEVGEPLLAAGHQVPRTERVGNSCKRAGAAHLKKPLVDRLKSMACSRIRLASQSCRLRQTRAEKGS